MKDQDKDSKEKISEFSEGGQDWRQWRRHWIAGTSQPPALKRSTTDP